MYEVIDTFSRWAIPGLLLLVLVASAARGVKVYEVFVEGAEEGFATAVRIIPYLVAMLVAISIFRASGAMDMLASLLAPYLNVLGLPAEVLPHAILRPLSGGAALGVASDIIKTHGPDSFLGRLVSTMQGSCDTTFYVLTLYFGSVGVKRYRYAAITGLVADLTTLIASVIIVRHFF